MNRPLMLSLYVALWGLLVVPDRAPGEDRRETDTTFANYKPLAAAVAKADKVALLEGLPHPMFEKKLLESELKTKKTVSHHGFPFYAEPVALKEADAKTLTKLFTDETSFKAFSGAKKCGGFHPDYCIEWHVGKDLYRCLVCFGCHEVKVFGPKTELYCDITKDAYDSFKTVLQPYRKNRPERKDE
ncbi:hypothetical protein [Frigoriglobus tundricola]|uniref:Uncharacterized protein n=1 Tax=Frigoriglobus tundricola TaxID=2774151 RepID=A0A6M5YME3_9BACT|nr:hypothetical protein [Frigoriglobus tundricola]QJW94473.1 hypothetical protein FTUN_1993 [Frigoriglobus tundricola]